jgi:predicted AAA+ superfamily ATPase
MLIRHLLTEQKINPANILYLNMEMHELLAISDAGKFMDVIAEYRKTLRPAGKVYLFLDEIQEVDGWEKAVNALAQDHATECEVFLTGSNAHLLSRELATYLTGRYVPVEVFPYSYGEYCAVTGQERGAVSFGEYLHHGGMPETINLREEETIRNYLLTLRDSILLNDIVRRHKVRDVALLQRLCAFLADSVGSLFSVNSVVRHLNGSGHKTNVETVANHLMFLTDAYLFHEAERYDIQGRRILTGERKYYLNDTALRYYLTSSFDPGIGKYLENALYLHLRRKGYRVYAGRSALGEVDMVAEKGDERMYCQAAYLLADENVVEREFRALMAISDNYPKYVISMDQAHLGNREGIRHVQAWEFID